VCYGEKQLAEERMRQIKKDSLIIETKILVSDQEIFTQINNLVEKSERGVSICTPIGGLQLLDKTKPLLESYKSLIKKYREGIVSEGIRWLTHIENTKEQVILVKKFLDIGINIRHVNNLPPLSFGVSEKQFQSTVEKMIDGKMIQNVLHSTEPLYIQHYQSLFEDIWNSAIEVQERIRQIETGSTLETTIVIENAAKTKLYFIDMVQNASKEILILFPSLNAIKREVIMGIIDLLKLKSSENIKIKVLSPVNDKVKELLLSNNIDSKNKTAENILCREIRKPDDLISTIVIVDRKHVLATELKDDSKEFFEEAIGLSTYSKSKPTILSYISIFESLWAQTEMSEDLKIANEKLLKSEQLEREFINIAAHELRTPTQAIMGYTELDREILEDILKNTESIKNEELRNNIIHLSKHFDALSRNASRLDGLINNLLDVAKIESNSLNSLQLQKEKIELVKVINNSINTELQQKIKQKEIKINFINDIIDEHYWIYADKLRLYQIINNLIGNAIKFTRKNGKIDILIKADAADSDNIVIRKQETIEGKLKNDKQEGGKEDISKEQIFVGISDTGKGISPQIMPNLFKKFITDSDTGTGLGLYITRNLIEAHGGKIWAFNNNDGVGSTFVFCLPIANHDTDLEHL
jgi:signal transduction histidine kinase